MESSLDPDQAKQRSRIAMSVKQTIFRADKKTLVDDARQNHADDWVISRLEQLPGGAQLRERAAGLGGARRQ